MVCISHSSWQVDPSDKDQKWMRLALAQAEQAQSADEVPIGAVMVVDEQAIGFGYNQPIALNDPTAHAEILAIRQACIALGTYRAPNATLYVTLMPCLMCIGAILQTRIKRVVVGIEQSRYSANPKNLNKLLAEQPHAWGDFRLEVGCLSDECETQLKAFFIDKRQDRETSLLKLQSLEHLPNVDKVVVTYLQGLGFQSGADFVKIGLTFAADQIETYAGLLCNGDNATGVEPKHVAMLKSLSHFLRGNPATSWKLFL